ncbi:MAG TPA: formylglycine-generating enzyme family protein [Chitinophagales bacterium]|nr:formylglycine-generating enzyme family protein [Chitinophagales bacterium]
MKNLATLIIILFFTGTAFSQNKGNTTSTDSVIMHKHAPRRVAETQPSTYEVVQSIEANMVSIPGGSFTMGCANDDDTDCYYWEKPAHVVTVGNFYIGKYPVTQREWEAIVGPNKYSYRNCPDCPVENVSWYDAQVFINKLNQLTGNNYRLPTAAEWEYAAGGGTHSHGYKYAGDNDINKVAWYSKNSGQKTQPVGQKKPNELGLFDMCGNVWQWCSDWFNDKYYSNSPANNPTGATRATYRCLRGGSWWSEAKDCRVVNRDRYPPAARDDDVGFRLARDW